MFGNFRDRPPDPVGIVLLGLWLTALALAMLYLIARIVGAWAGLF